MFECEHTCIEEGVIAHGRRVSVDHAKAAVIKRFEKAIEQVKAL